MRSRRLLRWGTPASVLVVLLVLSMSASATGPTSTPPPTIVPPGSPSPFPTVLHTPTPAPRPPPIGARAAVLANAATGQELFVKLPDQRRPIASLTKIMTALLVVETRDESHVVTVPVDATHVETSALGLQVGERITVRELLYALLLQSANDAAIALADDISGTSAAFVKRMNARARSLGMRDTRFASPNGLDDAGYSTARDLATLTRQAMAQPAFARIVDARAHAVPAPEGGVRHIQNRNVLLWLYAGATGVKTGFTTPAGHCLVATARRDGRRLIAVVLGDGADSDFDDGASLLNFGFDEFTKMTLVRPGDLVGAIDVEGRSVPVAAAAGLVRLVRTDRVTEVRRFLRPAASLRLPVLPGQAIGQMEIRAHGVPLGTVPVVAVHGVAARPAEPPRGPPLVMAARELAEILRTTFGPFL